MNDFAHDCYYISKNEESLEDKKEKNWYSYYDKIILDNGKKRIKKTDFYIPEPDELYTILLRRFFKVFYKDEFKDGTQIVGGYDTVIFRKEKNKMTVDEIEQKFNI